MIANEAPEKIYCGNNGHGNLSYSNLPFPNAVEYTRTDVFIEKACVYSKDNYTDEDRQALCDGCEEECNQSTERHA